MIIYKAVNKINEKIYIGQTINSLQQKKSEHYHVAKYKKSKNNHFHNALRKYKKEDFKWEIIDKTNCINELNKKEIFWIKKYNSYKKGYNERTGGKNNKLSITAKEKISKFLLGRKVSEKIKKQISSSMKNRKFSKKHKQNLSIALKGNNSKKLICVETGEFFNSFKDFFKRTGISPYWLEKLLKKEINNIKGLHYSFIHLFN